MFASLSRITMVAVSVLARRRDAPCRRTSASASTATPEGQSTEETFCSAGCFRCWLRADPRSCSRRSPTPPQPATRKTAQGERGNRAKAARQTHLSPFETDRARSIPGEARAATAQRCEEFRARVQRARLRGRRGRRPPLCPARLRSATGPASCASWSTRVRSRPRAASAAAGRSPSASSTSACCSRGPAASGCTFWALRAALSAAGSRRRGRPLRSGAPGWSWRAGSRSRRSPPARRRRRRGAQRHRAGRLAAVPAEAPPAADEDRGEQQHRDREDRDLPHPVEDRGDAEGDEAGERRGERGRAPGAGGEQPAGAADEDREQEGGEQGKADDPQLAQRLQVEGVGVAHRFVGVAVARPPEFEGAGAGAGQRLGARSRRTAALQSW